MTDCNGPKISSGESATATIAAPTEPSSREMPIPSKESVAVFHGRAPTYHMTSRSSVVTRIRRAMSWMAMRTVATPAMSPKTANAIDSGLTACCASFSITDVTWK